LDPGPGELDVLGHLDALAFHQADPIARDPERTLDVLGLGHHPGEAPQVLERDPGVRASFGVEPCFVQPQDGVRPRA
jgi:hypothetical protein